ncbi:dihydropyrimidinase [Candidatus Bipolaricaulota bacterium]
MTRQLDLVIRGGTVVTPSGSAQTHLGIAGERIVAIGEGLSGRREIDATGRLVLPGVIDVHTHMAAPAGGATSTDDFLTGSRAAAAGGVTTIVDFTVASPGSNLPGDIECRKRDAEESIIDVALHAEVIGWSPGREEEIGRAIAVGVSSFKFYMAYGSLGQRSDSGALYQAFRTIAEHDGVAMIHGEDDPIIDALLRRLSADEKRSMTALPRSRPSICEGAAISQAAYLAEKTGVRLHVCHISSALGVEALVRGRQSGAQITGETCPQYLVLTDHLYSQESAEQFSVMPPLRTAEDQEVLWNALSDRTLSCVATDHCPFNKAHKHLVDSFEDLPYGFPGVETLLPLLYSEGVATGRLDLCDIPRLLSEQPAKIFGISHRKGSLEVGADADIVIFDPDKSWTVAAGSLHMNTDFSPYEGRQIQGAVTATILRGSIVYENERIVGQTGAGQFIPSIVV